MEAPNSAFEGKKAENEPDSPRNQEKVTEDIHFNSFSLKLSNHRIIQEKEAAESQNGAENELIDFDLSLKQVNLPTIPPKNAPETDLDLLPQPSADFQDEAAALQKYEADIQNIIEKLKKQTHNFEG